jgi:hypothetical protein
LPIKASGLLLVFGTATGVFFPVTALDPKRLELLSELVPQLRLVAVLVNPANPNADVTLLARRRAASAWSCSSSRFKAPVSSTRHLRL